MSYGDAADFRHITDAVCVESGRGGSGKHYYLFAAFLAAHHNNFLPFICFPRFQMSCGDAADVRRLAGAVGSGICLYKISITFPDRYS